MKYKNNIWIVKSVIHTWFNLTLFKYASPYLLIESSKFAIGTKQNMTILNRSIFFLFLLFTFNSQSQAQETKKPKDYIIEGKVTIENNKPATKQSVSTDTKTDANTTNKPIKPIGAYVPSPSIHISISGR